MKNITPFGWLCAVSVAGIFWLLPAQHSSAALITLQDQNASATIDTTGLAGVSNLTIDGNTVMTMDRFYFRVGSGTAGARTELGTLSHTVTYNADDFPNTATVTYTSAALHFKVAVTYTLTAASEPGDPVATLRENIRLYNTYTSGSTKVDFHLFRFADYDLAGGLVDDTIQLASSATSPFLTGTQTNAAGGNLNIRLSAGSPNTYVAGDATALQNTIANTATALTNNASYTGNAAYALEWDRSLARGSSVSIDFLEEITTIPEPASASMVVLVGAGLLFRRRKYAA